MIEVEVEAPQWSASLPDAAALALAAAASALAHGDSDAGVAVLLTDDRAQRTLNARFRSKDVATNVLAFPAARNPEGHLGDVSVAFETAASEAHAQGKSLEDHLQHLVVHGVLHLLGYDHATDLDAERMEALERDLLAGLGVPDPYAERGHQGDHGEHRQ